LRRTEEAEQLWTACAEVAAKHRLSERAASALYDAAHGLRLRNALYRKLVQETLDEEISELTASRDLKAMVDAQLLEPVGERRARHYLARESVLELRRTIRHARPVRVTADPFDLASRQLELNLN
jgi:hypothetical protein